MMFSRTHILCIGDVILDRFVEGFVNRLSPEAPVPVLDNPNETCVLGGAANVAANIVSMSGKVILASVLGCDESANTIEDLSKPYVNLHTEYIREQGRVTSEKTRFCSQGQHLLRVDRENTHAISEVTINRLKQQIWKTQPDIVILSDYNKGVLTEALTQELIQHYGKKVPILVDPKGRHYQKYTGAFLIKPNVGELSDVVGHRLETENDIIKAAQSLCQQYRIQHVLVTRGRQGMCVISQDHDPLVIPAHARTVYDVSGAGDTVIAALALGLASHMSIANTAHMANMAASLVIQKAGTATITYDELMAAQQNKHNEKHVSLTQLMRQIDTWRHQKLTIGFTNGCFDLLHQGHIHLLTEASHLCDRLVIGLNSDASVKRLKGEDRPIQDEQTRAVVLSALSMVAAVVIFDELTPLHLIESINPDVLMKGQDYTVDQIIGADSIRKNGGKVITIPLKEGHSTTRILKQSGRR